MKALFNPRLVPGLRSKKPLPDSLTLRTRIGQLTANEFGINYDDMFIKCRKRENVLSRQVSMMLIKHYEPGVSLKSIGLYFGGKDHTTVIHSIKTVNNLMSYDHGLRDRVDKIQEML